MLSQGYKPEKLKLVSKADWHPYPTAQERDFWDNLPAPVRQTFIQRGEVALDFDWPSLRATLFLEVARIGNRNNYEQVNFQRRDRLVDLILAECVEGQGRFVDAAVNGIWLICEESYWGLPAHLTLQKAGRGLPDTAEPTVDLFAAETAALLAYAHYLLAPQLDTVSPLIRPRIAREIDERILTPNLEREDFGWMGFAHPRNRPNNWNPWINSNWLACVLLIEPDRKRRQQAVAKIMRSLDKFIDPYPTDGGCDEGPGYWDRAAASLFDCLDLLHSATQGQVDVFADDLVRAMGQFIYRVQISEEYFVNFADAAAIIKPDASLIYRYGKAIHDPAMMALGARVAQQQQLINPPVDDAGNRVRIARSLGRALPMLASLREIADYDAYAPLPRDVWLPEIEVMTARDTDRSTAGFYVAAKGGHNAESHNHNDIGHFVVFIDGLPVLVDAGVETYSVKTFSERRYEIWTMQSGYHNLPTINGVMQAPGKTYAARHAACQSDDQHAQMRLDIAKAYPAEAQVKTWLRTITLERGQAVIVADDYKLAQPPHSLTLNLLTPCAVDSSTPGLLRLSPRTIRDERQSGSATLHYPAATFSAAVETVPVADPQLGRVWGDQLFRVVLTVNQPAAKDTWTLKISR